LLLSSSFTTPFCSCAWRPFFLGKRYREEEEKMKGLLTETTVSHDSIELANATAVNEKHGTQRDELDMDRMGKLQQLKVSSHALVIASWD
jgi:hypothetical protein